MPITFDDPARREFHVSRAARDRYRFEDGFFGLTGNVVLADFRAARRFAAQMNAARDLASDPSLAVSAGDLNAMGLIDEVLHVMLRRYREQHEPDLLAKALDSLATDLGSDRVERTLAEFVREFPPVAVYRGEIGGETYLAGASGATSHREVVLEELLMLRLANLNPAYTPFEELFDEDGLDRSSEYPQVTRLLERFLDRRTAAGPEGETLWQLLRAPALASPGSLAGQLDFIRTRWGAIIGADLTRLLTSLDLIAEEQRPVFPPGPGPVEIYRFAADDPEVEAFSEDLDWMPRAVLLAKNAFVWLDQLSRLHQREIHRLDQVPDEELDRLARWGITGLWLIGVWQRSRASKEIKHRMGNAHAEASAYSLADYRIADDLGGQEAWDELKARAWSRGIRMATDMVPNHMGIDSRWVVEHPDWFVGLPSSPFPTYTFNGPDLSHDDRVGIFLEDGYWDRRDAAVVFKRVDRWTGDVRFIYHGNDGTSMPWNDTAQLDYLNPEVREAVIQTILHVARLAPIIRFDAAMTLAKRHYQRLWFPEPGSGGDIPSRAGLGLTREAFDAAMPKEFWREVVDRVAVEAPDTLLLAEAFWLLEGYFVRTLGMHRVYNSAFMNMLRDERNADYRQLIKNTLEFDPQILKRFVNFMSNPDERTAVDQFGDGDKYFGVCTLMATLPGLPMFGHGQVEGLREKYGMEFRRAAWDEPPNQGLVERHRRQVFPLLRRRRLFAEVDDFVLFDFYTGSGAVDENVFAYTNRHRGERTLVLYHNRYGETAGWVKTSAAFAQRAPDGDKQLVRRELDEALQVSPDPDTYLVLRDLVDGLEYLRGTAELGEKGLYAELKAYQLHVFAGLREVRSSVEKPYAELAETLAGRGVRDVDEALDEIRFAAVLEPLATLLEPESMAACFEPGETTRQEWDDEALEAFHAAAVELSGCEPAQQAANVAASRARVEALRGLAAQAEKDSGRREVAEELLTRVVPEHPAARAAQLAWAVAVGIGSGTDEVVAPADRAVGWRLGRAVERAALAAGAAEEAARRAGDALVVALAVGAVLREGPRSEVVARAVSATLGRPEGQRFLGVNRWDEVEWYRRESFDEWIALVAAVAAAESVVAGDEPGVAMVGASRLIAELEAAETASSYRVDRLPVVQSTRTAGMKTGSPERLSTTEP